MTGVAVAGSGWELGPDDLVLSHFTLGRHGSFPDRVAAAAAAGYAGIGLYYGEYQRLRAEGHSDADLRAVLDHHGLRVTEVEVLRGWSARDPDAARAYRESERAVLALADALGPAHHVQVVGPYEGTRDDAAEAFAGVCDRLGEHGLGVAIEFLPEMSNIPDAGVAMQIVTAAGRANAGLCVDVWHHVRGADDDELLRAVPPERVLGVQIDDGPLRAVDPDYYTDCTRYRQVPGEGEFDLVRFLRLLDEMGVRQPLSVEVLSVDLLALLPAEAARRAADGTRAVLARARAGRAPADGGASWDSLVAAGSPDPLGSSAAAGDRAAAGSRAAAADRVDAGGRGTG